VIDIKNEEYPKYFFILLIIAVLVVVFLVVKPFITTILTGAITAYVFYPIYNWLNNKTKKKNLSALLVTILVILLITLPLFFVVDSLSKEAYVMYLTAKQKMSIGGVLSLECIDAQGNPCIFSTEVTNFLNNPKVAYQLQEAITKLTNFVINYISALLVSVPFIILNFFVMVFIVFYLLRDGPLLVAKLQSVLPLKKSHQDHVFQRFEDVTHAVIFGHVSVALIQGALGAIGFIILGIHAPILWGALMAFFALLPFIGPPVIWLPIAIMQILDGYYDNNTNMIIRGLLLILYGALIIGTIDNILKPKLISNRADVHPVLVLLGVLGGLKMFGIMGIFIGPLLLALFMAFIKIYEEEKSEVKS